MDLSHCPQFPVPFWSQVVNYQKLNIVIVVATYRFCFVQRKSLHGLIQYYWSNSHGSYQFSWFPQSLLLQLQTEGWSRPSTKEVFSALYKSLLIQACASLATLTAFL